MADGSSSMASFRRHAWIGLGSVALLAGGLGGWAAATDIAGAVIAAGTIAVEGGSKRVQHQEGGIVDQILVRNGDVVAAGDILLHLDGTSTAANLAIIQAQLSEALALKARLTAESAGDGVLVRAPEIEGLATGDVLDALFSAQTRLLETRAAARSSLSARLTEQIAQIEVQITGLEAQKEAVSQQLAISTTEEAAVARLLDSRLVEESRLNLIKRERIRLVGEEGRLVAEIASARASIAERRLQLLQSEREFQSEVLEELQVVNQKVAELSQQQIAALDRLARLDIRSPQNGIVHESTVRTVGGVVGGGETLMLVVPSLDRLVVEARVSPIDVDKLYVGQSVMVRLSSLDARTTPELIGSISAVGADLTVDAHTGVAYFLAKVGISDDELLRLPGDTHLLPGMPAEAFIQTGNRSVLSYLVHPFVEQITHAFREQ